MTTPDPATAYQQFAAALAKWWETPGRSRLRKPELADFTNLARPEPTTETKTNPKKKA